LPVDFIIAVSLFRQVAVLFTVVLIPRVIGRDAVYFAMREYNIESSLSSYLEERGFFLRTHEPKSQLCFCCKVKMLLAVDSVVAVSLLREVGIFFAVVLVPYFETSVFFVR